MHCSKFVHVGFVAANCHHQDVSTDISISWLGYLVGVHFGRALSTSCWAKAQRGQTVTYILSSMFGTGMHWSALLAFGIVAARLQLYIEVVNANKSHVFFKH